MLTFFETWNKGELPNLNKHDEADFACLKSMGVDVIRLVCDFALYTEEASGIGKIDEAILKKVDEICDWAERNQIYLIIDNHNNHTFDPFGQWTYTNNDFIFCKNILNQSGLRLRYVIKTEAIISFTKL